MEGFKEVEICLSYSIKGELNEDGYVNEFKSFKVDDFGMIGDDYKFKKYVVTFFECPKQGKLKIFCTKETLLNE